MGSMAVALGKKLIARMKRKSMCPKECTLEPQEEGILGLERQSALDAVQCDHSRFTTNFDPPNAAYFASLPAGAAECWGG